MRRFVRFAVISALVGAIVAVVLRNRREESWSGRPAPAKSRPDPQPASAAPPAPATVTAASTQTVPAAAAKPAAKNDMLVAIKGLGPKSEEQLRAAGIHTYDELAAMSVPEIESKLSPPPPGADFSSWIAQARDLARRRDSDAAQS
jgi:predicted flap endonuclease-1-like 5' DNA nuclease